MNVASKETVYQEFCDLYPVLTLDVTGWEVESWDDKARGLMITLSNGLSILFEICRFGPEKNWDGCRCLIYPKK